MFDTKNRYEWEKDKGPVVYGDDGSQKSYKNIVEKSPEGTVTGLLSEVDTKGDLNGGIALYTTQEGAAEPQMMTVTIWLEGWQKIGDDTKNSENVTTKNAAMWADDLFKNGEFHVGMQFGCEA